MPKCRNTWKGKCPREHTTPSGKRLMRRRVVWASGLDIDGGSCKRLGSVNTISCEWIAYLIIVGVPVVVRIHGRRGECCIVERWRVAHVEHGVGGVGGTSYKRRLCRAVKGHGMVLSMESGCREAGLRGSVLHRRLAKRKHSAHHVRIVKLAAIRVLGVHITFIVETKPSHCPVERSVWARCYSRTLGWGCRNVRWHGGRRYA